MKIKYPTNCKSKNDRLDFLAELDEELRLEHNQKSKTMIPEEVHKYFRKEFFPKSKTIHNEINRLATFNENGEKQKGSNRQTWKPKLNDVITGKIHG